MHQVTSTKRPRESELPQKASKKRKLSSAEYAFEGCTLKPFGRIKNFQSLVEQNGATLEKKDFSHVTHVIMAPGNSTAKSSKLLDLQKEFGFKILSYDQFEDRIAHLPCVKYLHENQQAFIDTLSSLEHKHLVQQMRDMYRHANLHQRPANVHVAFHLMKNNLKASFSQWKVLLDKNIVQVYKAVMNDGHGEKPVIIKVADNDRYEESYVPIEVEILEAVQENDKYVQLYQWFPLDETGSYNSKYVIVMEELVPFKFSSLVYEARYMPLPDYIKRIKKWLYDILLALQHLHEKMHYIHADVKTVNVGLRGERAVLMDFDLALENNDTGSVWLDMEIGTSGYMAPEIHLQSATSNNNNNSPNKKRLRMYSEACDVYAFGVMLAEWVLCKEYSDKDHASVAAIMSDLKKIKHNEVYADFCDLLPRMLHNDPKQRITIKECIKHAFFA